jgi:hypothetical protein
MLGGTVDRPLTRLDLIEPQEHPPRESAQHQPDRAEDDVRGD